MKLYLIGLFTLMAIVGLLVGGTPEPHGRNAEVTWYQDGDFAANGDPFRVDGFTCAVRDRREWKRWIRFEYQQKVVYYFSNDLMPEGSRAEYDLTPVAFMRLAPLRTGRIKAIVRVVE